MDARIDKFEQDLLTHQAGLTRLRETGAKAVELAELKGRVETLLAHSDTRHASIEKVEDLRADIDLRTLIFVAALTVLLGFSAIQYSVHSQMEKHMDRFEQRMDKFEQRMLALENKVDGLSNRVLIIEQKVDALSKPRQ
jgi:hypothetical protein